MLSKRPHMSRWNVAWSSWVASFAVIEALAIRSKNHQATLSYHTWNVFGFKNKSRGRRALGMAAWVWFLVHILKWEDKTNVITRNEG